MPSTSEKNVLEVHRARGCAGSAGQGCSVAKGALRSALGERTLLSHCISTASLLRCCTKSVCRNPDASLLPCRKQQCPRGHRAGSGGRPTCNSCLPVLAQLLVPAQSKALVQATHSRDACPGGQRLERAQLQWELLFAVGIEPQIPKPVDWRWFKSFIVPV